MLLHQYLRDRRKERSSLVPPQDMLCLHTHKRLIWGEKQKVTIQLRSLLILTIVRVLCTFVQFSRESVGDVNALILNAKKM